jgi:hypothetical protein
MCAPFDAAVLGAAPVGQQRDAAVRHVVAVDLAELVSADILEEQEVPPGSRLIGCVADRLVKERQLGPRAARLPDAMDLGRVGKPRGDQDRPFRRMPVRKRRRTGLRIPPDFIRQRRRDRRKPLNHQVLPRPDLAALSQGTPRNTRHNHKHRPKEHPSPVHGPPHSATRCMRDTSTDSVVGDLHRLAKRKPRPRHRRIWKMLGPANSC